MNAPIGLPRSVAEVTPAWLSQALGTGVESFRIEREIHGTSTKLRLALDYAGPQPEGPPRVLWLKAGMEPHSPLMASFGIYEHEARFYAELCPKLELTVARCWFAGHDPATRAGVLLLQDLDAVAARYCGVACQPGLSGVRAILDQLARLHAKWWDSSWLDQLGWLQITFVRNTPGVRWFESHSEDQLRHYIELPRGDAMPVQTRDPARIFKAFWTLVDGMAAGPRCLLHGDAHIGNSYLLPNGSAGYLDWQVVRQGCWAHDVAYYLASALPVELRRRHERELLAEYLERLGHYGATPPDFDRAWLEYRRNMVYGLIAFLLNPENNGFQPEPLNVLCTERYSAAVADLESFQALGV